MFSFYAFYRKLSSFKVLWIIAVFIHIFSIFDQIFVNFALKKMKKLLFVLLLFHL